MNRPLNALLFRTGLSHADLVACLNPLTDRVTMSLPGEPSVTNSVEDFAAAVRQAQDAGKRDPGELRRAVYDAMRARAIQLDFISAPPPRGEGEQ